MQKVLYAKGPYRILEVQEFGFDLADLKGDCFVEKHNPDINHITLKKQELDFEQKVLDEGVFGYVLELWDPRVGAGWETVDSCWGFVGAYSETNNHYIVDVLKSQIKETEGGK